MSKAIAIHIGMNHVDPAAYEGWDGRLDACENDAVALAEITEELGYDVRMLLSAEATEGAVLGGLRDAAESLGDGDICVVTYAGHGGQFRNLGDDEEDSKDETWLLFDREILDDEIHLALSRFAAGVRVVVLSDSCHSGTIVRGFYERAFDDSPDMRAGYARVARGLRSRPRASNRAVRTPRWRGAPETVQAQVLKHQRARYEAIRARTPARGDVELQAHVISISGCQDNQESMEADGHGVFTAALLDHWDGGGFTGSYPAMHAAILEDLPPTQTPALLMIGPSWPGFEAQVPFTIAAPAASAAPVHATANGTAPVLATVPSTGAAYRIEVSIAGDLNQRDDPHHRRVVDLLAELAATN